MFNFRTFVSLFFRASVNRIGIFIVSESYGVIAPVTIPAAVTVASISSSLSVPGPAGNYELITDVTLIESLSRVTDLFFMTLNLDLGATVEADVVTALIQASATLGGTSVAKTVVPTRVER